MSASQDPDHNASKKDVLVLQEPIMKVQARTDERYQQSKVESEKHYCELKTESDKRYHELRADANTSYHKLQEAMIKAFQISVSSSITGIVMPFMLWPPFLSKFLRCWQ